MKMMVPISLREDRYKAWRERAVQSAGYVAVLQGEADQLAAVVEVEFLHDIAAMG